MSSSRGRLEWLVPSVLVAVLVHPAASAEGQAPAEPKKLGILVFPGVQVIDFTGPYEVLSGASSGGRALFEVVTVGLTSEMFRAGCPQSGIRMLPDVAIDDCPRLDVLVIPGGEVGAVEDNPKAMEWIAKAVGEAECVMSVCNGAFVLARGGHLKGQPATTFYYFIDDLAEAEPTCTPVSTSASWTTARSSRPRGCPRASTARCT